jgi:nucleotide-binding universal stress UspA family protein
MREVSAADNYQGSPAIKTILLHVHDDDSTDSRMQVALDLARAHGGHLECLQVVPLAAVEMTGMYGNLFITPDLVDVLELRNTQLRADTEARLAHEDVSWNYTRLDGDPARAIIKYSRLADIVVLSRVVSARDFDGPLPLAGDVALHASVPVLAVPPGDFAFAADGAALITWNGSAESASALHAALPMLRLASAIHVVTIGEADAPEFPASDACRFLSRHGLVGEVRAFPKGEREIGPAILDALGEIGAAYVVMGAYGHSRAREYLFGGASRHLLAHCPVPLVLAH